ASEGVTTDTPPVNFVIAQRGDAVKLAGRAARAFLGVRIDCAQCHDHPFASWKRSDFEGLAAFWAGVHQRGPVVRDDAGPPVFHLDDRYGKRDVKPAVPVATEALPPSPHAREALARWLTDPRNPYFAKAFVNR